MFVAELPKHFGDRCSVPLASRCVRVVGQIQQQFGKLWRLTCEELICNEPVDGAYGINLPWRRRPDHRAKWEIRTNEFARNREDQVRLEELIGRHVEVRKRQTAHRIAQRSDWRLHPVARKINPLQEVADLVATNAECDVEDLGAGYFSAERRIQARTSLFNETEVEGSGVGNRLDVGCGAKIRVGSWDRGELTRKQCGKRLLELSTEIRIVL